MMTSRPAMMTIALLVVVMAAACTATTLPAVVDHTVADMDAGVVVMRKLMQDTNETEPEDAPFAGWPESEVEFAGNFSADKETVISSSSCGTYSIHTAYAGCRSGGCTTTKAFSFARGFHRVEAKVETYKIDFGASSEYLIDTKVNGRLTVHGRCDPNSECGGGWHACSSFVDVTSEYNSTSGAMTFVTRPTSAVNYCPWNGYYVYMKYTFKTHRAPCSPPPAPPSPPPPNVGDAIKNATDAVKDTIDKAKDAAGAAGNAAGAAGDVPKTGVADLKDESVAVTLGSSAHVYHSLIACVGTLALWALAA